MTEPLSVAASVAGIVALSGSVSKFFLQFYRSIHDAPPVARDLASALYTLNIALSQIQGSLLNPKFVAVADDDQLDAIEACLASCLVVFESLDSKLEASGLARQDLAIFTKSWASVKAYFNEEQISDYTRRVEREKTTLLVVVGNFSARLQADTLLQVQNLRVQLKNQGRRLKNIHVLVESFADFIRPGGMQRREWGNVRTAAFDLASAYDVDEIASLQSTDSVPSLTLGALSDRSVSCVWEPPPESSVPLRRLESEMTSGLPPRDSEGFYQPRARVIPLSSDDDILGALSTLGKVPTKVTRRQKVMEQYFKGAALVVSTTSPLLGVSMAAPYETIKKMLRIARKLDSDIFNDLQYIERSYTIITKHWTTAIDDETLVSVVKRAQAAMTEYLQWASNIFDSEGEKKGLRSDLRSIIKATPNAAERKRLSNALTAAVEEAKELQNLFAQNKMFEMQRELLALQLQKGNHERRRPDNQQTESHPGQTGQLQIEYDPVENDP
ncbi:MAG: hypothetical protein Q9167_002985 [Letrouitia subvulpina]